MILAAALAGSPDPFGCCVARMEISMERKCISCSAIEGRDYKNCSAMPGEDRYVECANECSTPCHGKVCTGDEVGWVVEGPLVTALLRGELGLRVGGWQVRSEPCEMVLGPVLGELAEEWCSDRVAVRVEGEQGSFTAVLRWQAGEHGAVRIVGWTMADTAPEVVEAAMLTFGSFLEMGQ